MSIPSARGPCASWQLTEKHWKFVTHNKRNILFILVWLKLNDDTIMLMGHNRMTNNLWWNTFWPTSVKNRNEYNKILSILRKYHLCQYIPQFVFLIHFWRIIFLIKVLEKSTPIYSYYIRLYFHGTQIIVIIQYLNTDYWKFWVK